MDKTVFTLKQAAEYLNISVFRLRKLVAAGEIASIHLTPRVMRISQEALNAFIERKEGGL